MAIATAGNVAQRPPSMPKAHNQLYKYRSTQTRHSSASVSAGTTSPEMEAQEYPFPAPTCTPTGLVRSQSSVSAASSRSSGGTPTSAYSASTPGESYPFPRAVRRSTRPGLVSIPSSPSIPTTSPPPQTRHRSSTLSHPSSASTPTSPVPDGPVIDMTVFQELLALDEDEDEVCGFTKGLIRDYFGDAEERVDGMARLLAKQNYLTLSKSAHSLRGSAVSLGVRFVATTCEALEMLALKDSKSAHDAAQLDAYLRAIRLGQGKARSWFVDFYRRRGVRIAL